VLAFFVFACDEPIDPDFKVTGHLDFYEQGLQGVEITLHSTTNGTVTTTTDENGNFTFNGVWDGTYTITPSKSNHYFLPPQQIIKITDKDPDNISFLVGITWINSSDNTKIRSVSDLSFISNREMIMCGDILMGNDSDDIEDHDDSDVLAFKVNHLGVKTLETNYDSPIGSKHDISHSVIGHANGFYIAASYFYENERRDTWIISSDTNLNIVNQFTYVSHLSSPDSFNKNEIVDLAFRDNGIVGVGYLDSVIDGKHILLLSLGFNLAFDYENYYEETQWDTATSISKRNINDFVVSGSCDFSLDPNAGEDSGDFFSMGIRSNYSQSWYKTYNHGVLDVTKKIITTTDGSFILIGSSETEGVKNIVVIKLDSSGTLLWEKVFNRSSYDEPVDVIQTDDGGFALCAVTYSGLPGFDYWFIKLKSDGEMDWDHIFDNNSRSDEPVAIVQNYDKGYTITGNSFYTENDNIIWTIKTNDKGICYQMQ